MSANQDPRPERADTDESLRVERDKTDTKIGEQTAATHAEADGVLEHARVLAEATLVTAREAADSRPQRASMVATVAVERAKEDNALETAQSAAAEQLEVAREEGERALVKLLELEREETDRRLELERARSDDVIASRDEFLAMVSHDLRNLLGGTALSASLMLRHTSEERTKLEAARIQRYTARANRLVGDLIDVVSIEAGKLHIAATGRDTVQLVREICESFQLAAQAKDISLSSSLGTAPLYAMLDVGRVQQVLANLVGNSLKFTGKGGRIELHVGPIDGFIQFSVLDNGTGVPPEKAAKIFDRFWQSKTDDRRGLGLGLYISRCIVEAHGGRIWFEPRPSGGSAFHFTVPA